MNMDFEKMYYLLKNEIVKKMELVKNNYFECDFNGGYFCVCGDLFLFCNSLENKN